MIGFCMVWRRERMLQPALEAIADGAKHYRVKYGRLPNFLNVPVGFLTEAELALLRERWTVATNAPAYFKDDVWLGVSTTDNAEKRSRTDELPSTSIQIPESRIWGEKAIEGEIA